MNNKFMNLASFYVVRYSFDNYVTAKPITYSMSF